MRLRLAGALAFLAWSCWVLIEGQPGHVKDSPGESPLLSKPRGILTSGRPAARDFPNTIRVVTWNLDGGRHFEAEKEALAKNPADLYLFQEVDWRAARSGDRDEAALLGDFLNAGGDFGIEFEELSQESGKPAYSGQATLTKVSRSSVRVVRFARQSGFWKPESWLPSSLPLFQRRLGGRIALVSEFHWEGRTLVVYNAHLESRSAGPIQIAQLEEMLSDAQRYSAQDVILLGGDLNTKYLPSYFLHKLEKAGFRSALGERVERTHTIAMALDWLFVRGPARFSRGTVRRDLKGSDHYPVYASLLPDVVQ